LHNAPTCLCFSYFSDMVSCFFSRQASNYHLPTYTSHIAVIMGVNHYFHDYNTPFVW
jgi:hypothetical protein